MDQDTSSDNIKPGVSIAFGPVDDGNMDVDKPATNGTAANGKRKASLPNGKNYKDASDSEDDDVPLVRDSSLLSLFAQTES